MKTRTITGILLSLAALLAVPTLHAVHAAQNVPYPVVDTGQYQCYDNSDAIACPEKGSPFHGQDAQYQGNQPSYTDNGDGTVTDNVTGLMWVKERGAKLSWDEAKSAAAKCRVGGHDDWRLPTIKELYSLIQFTGNTGKTAATSTPYIDTSFFDFAYGSKLKGERLIDTQYWSATSYLGTTMGGNPTAFGVNFADGRIKGYPKSIAPRGEKNERYVRYVRGNPDYGTNIFVDNGDGTVTDKATGLTWQQGDSSRTMNWQQALAYAENLSLAGKNDWRLPNAKELQSIVDYSRSPTVTHSAAIDPLFATTSREGYYWSSTTHVEHDSSVRAVYVAFGRAMGYMSSRGRGGRKVFMDVHGAGAQRSDPKAGDPDSYSGGFGPQGDDIRIYNYVRCVRGGQAEEMDSSAAASESTSRAGISSAAPGNVSQPGRLLRQAPAGRQFQAPPLGAVLACRDSRQGADCSFRHGKSVQGVCRQSAHGLLCVPRHRFAGMRPQHGR